MKKILIAMGNTILYERLMKNTKYEVISKDISYKEGILEVLSIKKNIDILILNELLEGEIDFRDLICKIREYDEHIEIIVFLENEKIELTNFLFSKGIFKIYINNQIDIDTFIINLEENIQDKTNELNEEIKRLKEIIKSQENTNKQLQEKGKITAIFGAYGSGKSIVSCILCKQYAKQGKKTLLIDFDIFNRSINVLHNVAKPKTNKNVYEINEKIIEVSKKEHILCGMDLLFKDNNFMDYINLYKMLEEVREQYDEIIIDNTSNIQYTYLKRILEAADSIIYLIVPTKSELKKAFLLYERIIYDFLIPKEKIKFFINKKNKYSLDEAVISKIFETHSVDGIIKYDDKIEIDMKNKIKKRYLKIE